MSASFRVMKTMSGFGGGLPNGTFSAARMTSLQMATAAGAAAVQHWFTGDGARRRVTGSGAG